MIVTRVWDTEVSLFGFGERRLTHADYRINDKHSAWSLEVGCWMEGFQEEVMMNSGESF